MKESEKDKNITLLANLSEGSGGEIPIKVKQNVFDRLEETLNKRGLTTKKVAAGIFVVGVAVGAGIAAKKIIDHKHEESERPLTDEENERFKGIIEDNYGKVFGYLNFRLEGNVPDAQDLTQRVFEKAYKNYNRFKPKPGLENPERSWLLWIAHNAVSNFFRDEGRKSVKTAEFHRDDEEGETYEERLVDPVLSNIHSIENIIEKEAEDKVRLRPFIHDLSEDAKLMLYLKHVELMHNKDIGYVLGRTEGAIKSLNVRTLNILKGQMEGKDLQSG